MESIKTLLEYSRTYIEKHQRVFHQRHKNLAPNHKVVFISPFSAVKRFIPEVLTDKQTDLILHSQLLGMDSYMNNDTIIIDFALASIFSIKG